MKFQLRYLMGARQKRSSSWPELELLPMAFGVCCIRHMLCSMAFEDAAVGHRQALPFSIVRVEQAAACPSSLMFNVARGVRSSMYLLSIS
jgi:hypothetical protein